MRQGRRDQRGIAAVEFALVAPFVLMLLLGMVTLGFTYSDKLSITNAVREGARYGSALDYSATGWATAVRDRVKATYFNTGNSVTDAEICVKLVNSSKSTISGTTWTGTSCGPAPDLTTLTVPSSSCAVIVWVNKPASIQLVIAPNLDFHIAAKSIAYYGRTVGTTCAAA